ncbi:transposase and inactivated derivatives [Gluconobacter frateurii NBRC 103465]|nr:transposase and inactivated derivatives [Gluconobacter frateurii NBRC 103465]
MNRWICQRPFFPKSHGRPPVDDRRVLSGIFFMNCNGLRWRDAPREYGPHKTLYNCWKRWGDKGIEIMFGRLKGWRRVATRYDRCLTVFFSAICFAATV